MKKIFFISVIGLAGIFCNHQSYANSVTVLIVNNSQYSIYGSSSVIHNGSFLVHDGPALSKAEVKKGSTAKFSTGDASPFCGTDGYVYYKAVANGKEYFFYVKFDVPYIGDNEFYYTCDAPFQMRHILGGPGSNVTISFEITGGPSEITPPAPPVNLPTTGNAWAAGNISWNSNTAGMPEGSITDAFEFTVVAPSKFYPNYPENKNPGFTSGDISPQSGRFTDYISLPNIKVQVQQNERKETERMVQNVYTVSLSYTISNLPNGIPLEVRVTPKYSFWKPGTATPPQTGNPQLTKWSVYAEKIKNEPTASVYKIAGCWMDGQGKPVGGDNNASNLGRMSLSKQLALIKQESIIYGDDIFKVPGMDNKRTQVKQATLNKNVNRANIKMTSVKQ